jgi:hypothetical protein
MPRQRQFELCLVDTLTIIANTNELLTARHDVDLHSLCASVKAVLNQFLDYGCRALHDLACGDLIDQVTGK